MTYAVTLPRILTNCGEGRVTDVNAYSVNLCLTIDEHGRIESLNPAKAIAFFEQNGKEMSQPSAARAVLGIDYYIRNEKIITAAGTTVALMMPSASVPSTEVVAVTEVAAVMSAAEVPKAKVAEI